MIGCHRQIIPFFYKTESKIFSRQNEQRFLQIYKTAQLLIDHIKSATCNTFHMPRNGIHAKVFTPDQTVGRSLKCIFTKLGLSTPSRFQDIVVQTFAFAFDVSVAILSVLPQKIKFWNAGLYIY